jgi:hypothetical protein
LGFGISDFGLLISNQFFPWSIRQLPVNRQLPIGNRQYLPGALVSFEKGLPPVSTVLD